jgi:hypothetical protein
MEFQYEKRKLTSSKFSFDQDAILFREILLLPQQKSHTKQTKKKTIMSSTHQVAGVGILCGGGPAPGT